MATIAERRRLGGRRPLVSGTGNYGIPQQAVQQPFQQQAQAPAPQGGISTDPALEEKKFAIGKLEQDIKLLAMQGYSINNLKGRLDKLNELTEDAKMHEAYNRQDTEMDAKFKEDYGAVPGTPAWEERWAKAFDADREQRMKSAPGYKDEQERYNETIETGKRQYGERQEEKKRRWLTEDRRFEENRKRQTKQDKALESKLTKTEEQDYKQSQDIIRKHAEGNIPEVVTEAQWVLEQVPAGSIDKTDPRVTQATKVIRQYKKLLSDAERNIKKLQAKEERASRSIFNKKNGGKEEKTIVRTGINKKTGKRVIQYSDGTVENAS